MLAKETAQKILKTGYVCDSCLGRQFSQLLSGYTNKERGQAIRKALAMSIDAGEKIDADLSNFYFFSFRQQKVRSPKPRACWVCGDLFERIDDLAKRAAKEASRVEFSRFHVGVVLSKELSQAEEKLWEAAGIEWTESIKSELSREIGKRLADILKREVELDRPEVVVLVNLAKDKIELEISPLFIYGRYKKFAEMPQTRWPCRECGGKGCARCDYTGKMYASSVEERIGKVILQKTKGEDTRFHGCIASGAKIFLNDHISHVQELSQSWKSQKIITFNENTNRLEASKITDFVCIPASNIEVFEIKTKETGRNLVATAEHPLYTQSGMARLKSLKRGDKIAVLSNPNYFETGADESIVVDEQQIKEVIKKYAPTSYTSKILQELKARELLPLYINSKSMKILTRLVAFIFGDGTAQYMRHRDTALSFYGKPEDLETVRSDIQKLGFKASLIRARRSFSVVQGSKGEFRTISGFEYELICYSKSLWAILVALGAPVGNKIKTEFAVPKWLCLAPLHLKREFLASLLGCEMSKPRLDNRLYNKKSFNSPRFSLNKSKYLLNNCTKFMSDLRKLLKEFGVVTLSPRVIPYTIRKDGIRSFKVILDFPNRFDNLLNLWGNIGFRYCREKEILVRYCLAYLQYKKNVLEKRKELYQKAIELKKTGLSFLEILHKLESEYIAKSDLWLWLNRSVRIDNIKVPNNFPDFDVWMKNVSVGLQEGVVWETIDSIKKAKASNLYEITVKKNHNFFANGFLVSNSGREDIDVRCLDWREFVIEITKPKIRKPDLRKIQKKINASNKGKIEVSGLRLSSREEVRDIKERRVDKVYRVIVEIPKETKLSSIKKLKSLVGTISQKTPTRVLHRRADITRKRKVKAIEAKKKGKKLTVTVRAESGLYVKELMSGDNGRTSPSVAKILNVEPKIVDVAITKIYSER